MKLVSITQRSFDLPRLSAFHASQGRCPVRAGKGQSRWTGPQFGQQFSRVLLSTHVDTLIWYCNMSAFYVLLYVYIYIYILMYIYCIYICVIYIICTNLYVSTFIHYIALHYATLRYVTLRYITLHTLHVYMTWHDITYIYVYIYIYLYTSISYASHMYLCLFFLWYLHLFWSACMPVCVVPFAVCIFMHAHKVARN